MKYNEEFKKNAVRLMLNRGSKSVKQIAEELEIRVNYLYDWRERYGQELGYSGKRNDKQGLSSVHNPEVERLRKQVRELEMERSFLVKAAAFFAKEKS